LISGIVMLSCYLLLYSGIGTPNFYCTRTLKRQVSPTLDHWRTKFTFVFKH